MISIGQLCKRYGKLPVLNNISLELNAGSCISLIGPNASGKTTLLKIILGIVRPDSGTIGVAGTNALEGYRYRENIGYMPQIAKYPDNMRVGQVINLLKSLRPSGIGYDEELYTTFRINEISNKPLRSLSGGTRQKVSACLAFMFKAPILILDEPTAGLDPLSAELLKAKIKKEAGADKLIIVTSHILSDLEDISTHIVYLHEGKILFHETISEILKRTRTTSLSLAVAEIMRNSSHV
ncbi:MAG TPA: ABC transporter ATP-binding protein [Bacteroidia bacterium]|nr:ABC transporter ATP-binding protein [Bacteroidia bacterium]